MKEGDGGSRSSACSSWRRSPGNQRSQSASRASPRGARAPRESEGKSAVAPGGGPRGRSRRPVGGQDGRQAIECRSGLTPRGGRVHRRRRTRARIPAFGRVDRRDSRPGQRAFVLEAPRIEWRQRTPSGCRPGGWSLPKNWRPSVQRPRPPGAGEASQGWAWPPVVWFGRARTTHPRAGSLTGRRSMYCEVKASLFRTAASSASPRSWASRTWALRRWPVGFIR